MNNFTFKRAFGYLAVPALLIGLYSYSKEEPITAPGPNPAVAVLTDAQYAKSVVLVTTPEEKTGGTGWITMFKGKKAIVTNDHVCRGIGRSPVTIKDDNNRAYLRRVIRKSTYRDLCLIEGIDAPVLPLANEAPKRFDRVKTMGHPLLQPTNPASGLYIQDIIATIGGRSNEDGTCPEGQQRVDGFFGTMCLQEMELSYTNVTIFPGNSGSPVVNDAGQVVGVMNAADGRSNQGLFIPLVHLKEFLEEQ